MSDSYAVKYQEGYESLAGGIGSGSAMFGFDKISGGRSRYHRQRHRFAGLR